MKPTAWLLIIFLLFRYGFPSPQKGDCTLAIEHFKRDNYSLIITWFDLRGSQLILWGRSPKSGEHVHIFKSEGWYQFLNGKYAVGDTVVKNEGERWFTIKKKEVNLKIEYNCNDLKFTPPLVISQNKTESRF